MIGRICLVVLLGFGMAVAQSPATATTAVPPKRLAFEVVSIRPDQSTPQKDPPPFGPTPDGYHLTNMPLLIPMLTAYVPQTGDAFFTEDRVSGLPDWFTRDRYDIDAKVADTDLAKWQTPASQAVMLPLMLQAMFADRCKMAVHREMKEISVYLLEVGKGGPRFKQTNPDEAHPEGNKLPWGGVLVNSGNGIHLYGVSMRSLAALLSSIGGNAAGRPIQDNTGLADSYDIALKRPDSVPQSELEGGTTPDPGSGIVLSLVQDLGLKLVPSKAPVEMLVIDYMEKPSAN